MNSRKWFYIVSVTTTNLFLLTGLINYIIDPLQFYRLAGFYKPYLQGNYSRMLNPGLAKNLQYETAILGSSHTANFDIQYINRIMKTKSVNLPIFGTTCYEMNFMLNKVISIGKAKYIILGIDLPHMNEDPKLTRVNDFPYHLYDDNPFNDYKYIFNFDLLRKMMSNILHYNFVEKDSIYSDYEKSYNWISDPKFRYIFDEKNLLKIWKPAKPVIDQKKRDENCWKYILTGEQNINLNILPYLKKNPKIKFYIIYYPFSALYWINMYNSGQIEGMIKLKKYFFENTENLSNVKIFDFQVDEGIKNNLNNYSDIEHYSGDINRLMVDWIVQGKYLVTEKNIDQYLQLFNKQVNDSLGRYKPL